MRLYAAFTVEAVIASAGDIFICVHARDRTIGMLRVGEDPGLKSVTGTTARDLVAAGVSGELFTVEAHRSVEEAAKLMSLHDFSQISVTKDGRIIGSLNETHLYEEIVRNAGVKKEPVESIMQPAFPFVDISTPVGLLSTMITPGNPAVLIRDFKTDKTFIITRSDVIRVLM